MKKNLLILFMLLLSSCSGIMPLNENQIGDYKKTGFLNKDNFQVIITGTSSNKNKSLTESREIARIDAINKMEEQIRFSIISESLKLNNNKNKPDFYSDNTLVQNKADKLMKIGRVFSEFYDKNNNIIIIYRISKKNLFNDIKNITNN